jgi:hypothetical protein
MVMTSSLRLRLVAAILLLFPIASGLSSMGRLWAQEPAAPNLAESGVFTFQNSFWVNLHHFLRGEARRRSMKTPLELPLSSLDEAERTAWESALDAYAHLATLNLIFDRQLVQIDNLLAKTSTTVLRSDGIEPEIVQALNGAAPVYRAHRWTEHQRENERWIAVHGPSIRQYAAVIKRSIAKAFQATPPSAPILVDLARDIGPNLAYTTAGPEGTGGHTVIAPRKNSESDVAMDTIFHEISHTMDGQIVRLVDSEAERQHVHIPSDLWHAMTLYTTGEIVRKQIGGSGNVTAYRPELARTRMFERNGWSEVLVALKKYWQPYLNGTTPLERALRDLVRNVAQ